MSTTFEVEADISFDDLVPAPKAPPRTVGHDPHIVADNYHWLHTTGHPEDVIAERLGLDRETLRKHLRTANYQPPLLGRNLHVQRTIDRLIATRQPFTCESLPEGDSKYATNSLVRLAHKQGRIRRAGKSTLGYILWEATTEQATE